MKAKIEAKIEAIIEYSAQSPWDDASLKSYIERIQDILFPKYVYTGQLEILSREISRRKGV